MNRTTLRWGVIILTLITALLHLFLGVGGLLTKPGFLSIAFIGNFLGYMVLLGAIMLPSFPLIGGRTALAHWLMMGFAALTIVLFFVFNGQFSITGLIVKVDEVLLIIATFLHMRAA